MPSLFDYLGYIYICCGTIAGPFFEFKNYKLFINKQGNYANIPSTYKQTLIRFSHAIFFILMNSVFGDYFPIDYMLTPEFAA